MLYGYLVIYQAIAGLLTGRFQSSSLAFEHGRLRRPGSLLVLRVVPSRREALRAEPTL